MNTILSAFKIGKGYDISCPCSYFPLYISLCFSYANIYTLLDPQCQSTDRKTYRSSPEFSKQHAQVCMCNVVFICPMADQYAYNFSACAVRKMQSVSLDLPPLPILQSVLMGTCFFCTDYIVLNVKYSLVLQGRILPCTIASSARNCYTSGGRVAIRYHHRLEFF